VQAIYGSERDALLAFVDSFVPEGCQSVWLAGSRAKGCARAESDWDVVAIHPDAPSIATTGPIINQIGRMPNGTKIEVVVIAPQDWDHEGRFMADCRAIGLRIR
jgi:hypothetical protein